MLNNGFVNKNSIMFDMEKIDQPLIKTKEKFILFQYNPLFPQVKYVWLNGEINLPPIKMNNKLDISNSKGNIAIKGVNVNLKVPPEYKLIGQFNTPNSYKLTSEVWLIPSHFSIDLNRGTCFIINTPNNNERSVLEKIINKNSIKVINKESIGSYNLTSNKLLNTGIKISLVFITVIFMITGVVWISKEKSFIRILYLSGFSMYKIFIYIVMYKIIPIATLSLFLIFISFLIQKFTLPIWTNEWIFYSFYMFIGFYTYLLVCCLKAVKSYTVGKGGKKF
ncbi:hypothetical protein [Bacillus sp. FJAT-27445]|uniref:hypothetical protein n=1 Tax=Bacillus sp. FJAT-27445 TaxID=1679166 RepID=UPI000744343E|nr:hypothetical protein [Bacillus sp. FJAT-27445]